MSSPLSLLPAKIAKTTSKKMRSRVFENALFFDNYKNKTSLERDKYMSSILLTAITAVVAAASLGSVKTAEAAPQKETNDQYEVIDLKDKVMRDYYNELDESLKVELDFETFEKGYYESDMPIRDYTETVKETIEGLGPKRSLTQVGTLFIGDARHIISNHRGSWPFPFDTKPNFSNLSVSYDQSHVMDFSIQQKRDPDIPVYYDREELPASEQQNYVPWYTSHVQMGDIVWDTISEVVIDFNDFITHMGMIVNPNKVGKYTDESGAIRYFHFVETIEAFAGGVRFGFLDDDRVLQCGTKVLRVAGASETARRNAVEFCMDQYDEAYDLDLFETNYNVPGNGRSRWYCTQLVFAAYYHQNIDLTYRSATGYSAVFNGKIIGPITGDMIAAGDCMQEIHCDQAFENQFIQISRNGSNFQLSNLTAEGRKVNYTGSLYNFCDAYKNYRTICHQQVYVYANTSATVGISYNLAANTAAAWYEVGNTMYVTLAHSFDDVVYVNSYIKTTKDKFSVKRLADDSYKITVKNTTSSTKHYSMPFHLLYLDDAVNKNANFDKTFDVGPNKSVSVTVCTYGKRQYLPIIISGYGRENNAALIRINLGKTTYGSSRPASVAKPINTQPEAPVNPFNVVQEVNDEAVYYFDFNDFYPRCHGGAEWYEVEGHVPTTVLEWDWDTVVVDEVILDGVTDYCWNEFAWFDSDTGEFGVQVSTFSTNPSGCVRIRYHSQGTLMLSSLSISGDYKTDYLVGEELDTTGIAVQGHLTYGYSHTINGLDGTLEIFSPDFDSETPGEYSVCIEYTERGITCVTSYDVIVRYPDIEDVDLYGDYQTVFGIGEEFNYDGLYVDCYLEDGHWTEADEIEVDDSEVDMSTAGEYTVYVTAYVNGISATASYTIIVEDQSLVSITLSGNYQTTFDVGDDFNYDGLVVTAHYANGDSAVVTNYSVITRLINMDQAGTYTVRVRYSENGVTTTALYDITVVYNGPALTGITLSGDYQTTFEFGEPFNHSGLIVTAHYSDGTSAQVTGFSVLPLNYNANSAGNYAVIVNYSDNGEFAIASYTVTVQFTLTPIFLESITLSGNYKTSFRLGQAFNANGLIVTAHYSDGSSAVVTDYVIDASEYDCMSFGTYTIRVMYTERFTTVVATYDVRIIGKIIDDPVFPPIIGKF